MIKTIALDCGGVILSNAWYEGGDYQYKVIPKTLGISEETATKIFHRRWPEISVGKSEDLFFNDLLEVAKNKIRLNELKELYYSCIQKKEAFEIVELLHEKYPDLPLYTLNNEGREWMDIRIKKFNMRKYFRDFITSGYCGYVKPDSKIYEILPERARVKAEDIFFTDNKEPHLLPAREIGYQTSLFIGKQQLKSELKNYGFIL